MAEIARRLSIGADAGRKQRDLVTPEGVALTVRLADRGERAAAVLLDLLLLGLMIGAVWVGALVAVATLKGVADWVYIGALLVTFALRNFYFIFFELRWQGTTPGKQLLRLKVIDRNGGALRADAVFARNLMREVELFMPATILLAGRIGGWDELLSAVWIGIFVLMPFFNRDNLRAGDLVAGTWVIAMPRAVLLPDLADRAAPAAAAAGATEPADPGDGRPTFNFTRQQLDAYGVYELQTLEGVLRRTDAHASATRDAVAERIRQKIGWTPHPAEGSRDFLEAYYAALRAHLETRMLFGKRRRDKHDR